MRHPASVLGILCLIALTWLTPLAARSAETDPREQVRQTVDTIIQDIADPTLTAEVRRNRVVALVRARFDFRAMSRRALTTAWKKATPTQRDAFVDRFSRLLLNTYLSRVEHYSGASVRYGRLTRDGRKARLDTVVVAGSLEIPIRYRLIQRGDQWRIYDVVIEEVSLTRNYRSTFRDILRKKGFDGLLASLDRKLAALAKAASKAP